MILFNNKELAKVKHVLLIYGLPGSGKTTLAKAIQDLLPRESTLWFNADKVRSTLSRDLGFKAEDRIEQARRMACVASLALEASPAIRLSIVDFVNPNTDTYAMFMKNLHAPDGTPKVSDANRVPESASMNVEYSMYSVFMNTIGANESRFADTAAMFNGSREADYTIDTFLESDEEFLLHAKAVVSNIVEKAKRGNAN